MQLHWKSVAPVGRHEPEDYVQSLRIDVRCWDKRFRREYLVARLGVDRIRWAHADSDGESLAEICDNDSQGLLQMYAILTEGGDDIREDLNLQDYVTSVVFVHNAVFHPAVHPFRVGILDAVFTLFGEDSLGVMWRYVGEVPEAEQVRLGLARVAGTDLVFRHNARVNPYAEAHPRGLSVDFTGTKDTHRWVVAEWKRLLDPGADDETSPAD